MKIRTTTALFILSDFSTSQFDPQDMFKQLSSSVNHRFGWFFPLHLEKDQGLSLADGKNLPSEGAAELQLSGLQHLCRSAR